MFLFVSITINKWELSNTTFKAFEVSFGEYFTGWLGRRGKVEVKLSSSL